MFRKILIANRGEIALRVIRTCRKLGIDTVAVYSEADRDAPFVKAACEALPIGPALPTESYLVAETIIAAAGETGAEAIHPGYGFLAEDAGFARACREAGVVFIGPSPETMEALSDKQSAREAMEKAGLPVIPGSRGPVKGEEEALGVARRIGYPLMIKACFGGGGIGMGVVKGPEKLSRAMRKASQRAERAFGQGDIYIEKLLEGTHHIEFQVLADHHGRVVTIFERECSVQRRRQKVIEETPSPFLDASLRREMSEAILRAASKVGYHNAGTFECLVDGEGRWYFLEINMRLQVEHPVTEMVSGLDLVEQQIRIAAGEELSRDALSVVSKGHAVEARLYAEDPGEKFLPRPGLVEELLFPEMEGLRVDSGVESGGEVTPFYDPLIAKIIALDEDRPRALKKLADALERTVIRGLTTNRDFLVKTLRHPVFTGGNYTTDFVEDHLEELTLGGEDE